MIFGLSTFAFVHTALSLLALMTGLVVVAGLLTGRRLDTWTAVYLAAAVTANATGFGFPGGWGIPHYIGGAGLLVLLGAVVARYVFALAGGWRRTYAVAATAGAYGLVFFTIGEAFLRIPALNAMAPTLTERPFVLAQVAALMIFTALAGAATVTFRGEDPRGASIIVRR
jgi:hypothetical protein